MYLIANISSQQIVISDLGISLGIKQAIDLHKVQLPIQPQRSTCLIDAIRKGMIKVLSKDSKKVQQLSVQKPVNNKLDKQEIIKGVTQVFQKKLQQSNQQSAQLMKQMLQLMKMNMQNNNTQNKQYVIKQQSKISEDSTQLNEKTLAKIHERAINKIKTQTSGNLDIKSENKKDTINTDIEDII